MSENLKIGDLDFKPHPSGCGGTQAKVKFPNGYGASVITGKLFYTDSGHPYELAVLEDDKLTYDTPITDDVLGYLTTEDVERVLAEIATLPPSLSKEKKNVQKNSARVILITQSKK